MKPPKHPRRPHIPSTRPNAVVTLPAYPAHRSRSVRGGRWLRLDWLIRRLNGDYWNTDFNHVWDRIDPLLGKLDPDLNSGVLSQEVDKFPTRDQLQGFVLCEIQTNYFRSHWSRLGCP